VAFLIGMVIAFKFRSWDLIKNHSMTTMP
jgi:hypothetical protein